MNLMLSKSQCSDFCLHWLWFSSKDYVLSLANAFITYLLNLVHAKHQARPWVYGDGGGSSHGTKCLMGKYGIHKSPLISIVI